MEDSQGSVLIATLGSEPQVVTAVTDLLEKSGEMIHSIWIIHTFSPEGSLIHRSIDTLRDVLPQAEFFCIQDLDHLPLSDVDTEQSTKAFFRLIFQLVSRVKHMGRRVHLCIAGGRKTMAVFGMAAAQMLFDEHDRLWHLASSGDFLTSKRLHPQPSDDTRLVQIPVILWSNISPVVRELDQADDPFVALERIRRLQIREKMDSARSFVLGVLTPAEQKVVELLVREGFSDQELAERLVLSPRTIAAQLRSVYHKAEMHWEVPSVGRSQLIAFLSLYYIANLGKNTDAYYNLNG